MTDEQQGLPQPQRNRAIIAILLGLGMSILSGSMVNLALPQMAFDLGCTFSDVIWVVSAYQAAALGTLLPCSALGDRIGYRQVYIGGVVLFTLGAFFCALSQSLDLVILMRILQGIGSAGVMGVNIALMRQIYPEFLLGRGIALNGIVVSICAVSGPFVAAQLLTFASWHWIFWLTLPIGAILFLLASSAFPVTDTRNTPAGRKNMRISVLDIGLNIFIFGLFFLIAGYWQEQIDVIFQNHNFWLWIVLWIALTYWYMKRQHHCVTPLFPIDLLKIKGFSLSIYMAVCAYCAQNLFFLSLPFLLLSAWGWGETQSGLLLAVWPLATAFASVPAGQMIGHVSNRLLSISGLIILSFGLGAFLLLDQEPVSQASVMWRMAVCGLGFCLFQTSNIHSIISTVPVHRSGAASGMLSVSRLGGQILAAIIVAAVFNAYHDLSEGVRVIHWVAFLFTIGIVLMASLRLLYKNMTSC